MRTPRPYGSSYRRLVTGPHARKDEDGEVSLYWRCEACGFESESPEIRNGCPECGRGVGWFA